MINHLREKGYAIEYSQKNQNYLLTSRDGHPVRHTLLFGYPTYHSTGKAFLLVSYCNNRSTKVLANVTLAKSPNKYVDIIGAFLEMSIVYAL